jgi:hypothetical protein
MTAEGGNVTSGTKLTLRGLLFTDALFVRFSK